MRIEHIGDATLYLGDCLEILPTLGKVDAVVTDPPYVHASMNGGGFASTQAFYRDSALDGMNDFDLSKYADRLIGSAPFMIAFHSRDLIYDYSHLASVSGRKYDLHFWYKNNAIPFCNNTWKSDVEYISLIWESKPGWAKRPQHEYSKAWISSINQDPLHPAAKPIPLLEKYIRILEPSIVCDPFMGSGTTGVACANLSRRFIGTEIEEKYFDIACKRIETAYLQPRLITETPPAPQPQNLDFGIV